MVLESETLKAVITDVETDLRNLRVFVAEALNSGCIGIITPDKFPQAFRRLGKSDSRLGNIIDQLAFGQE